MIGHRVAVHVGGGQGGRDRRAEGRASAAAVTVGASLTGVTVIETVAGAEVEEPSDAVNVNESGPA